MPQEVEGVPALQVAYIRLPLGGHFGVSSHFSAPYFCPLKNGSTKGPWPQAGLKSITHVKYKVRVLGRSKHFTNANQSTHMDSMASHCADARSLLEMRPDPPEGKYRHQRNTTFLTSHSQWQRRHGNQSLHTQAGALGQGFVNIASVRVTSRKG